MTPLLAASGAHAAMGRLLDHFRPLVLLMTRCYVAWHLWSAGWMKVSSWSDTHDVLRRVAHLPVPPQLAVLTAAAGAMLLATLLFMGLFSRFAAISALVLSALTLIQLRDASPAEKRGK